MTETNEFDVRTISHKAIDDTQFKDRIQFTSNASWKKAGALLQVEGPLISEGTWTGLDGQPVFYPYELLVKKAETWLGRPYKYGHRDQAESVVGYHHGVQAGDKHIRGMGYVFDPEFIKKFEAGEIPSGQSIEADVVTRWNDQQKRYEAVDIVGLATALGIKTPACDTARIEQTRRIQMGKDMEELEKLKAEKAQLEKDLEEAKVLKTQLEKLQGEKTAIETEKVKLVEQIETAKKAELEAIATDVKAKDPTFDKDKYLEGITDLEVGKRMLSQYREALAKIPKEVRLGAGDPKLTQLESINAASIHLFGLPYEDAIKQIANMKVQ